MEFKETMSENEGEKTIKKVEIDLRKAEGRIVRNELFRLSLDHLIEQSPKNKEAIKERINWI